MRDDHDLAMLLIMTADAPLVLHAALAIRDAVGAAASPGAVAVQRGAIVASGSLARVQRELGRSPDRVIDHGNALLLPAFVNAHAHLDLADVEPFEYRGSFLEWVGQVIARRPQDPAAITRAVHRGLRESIRDGVGWIGDIAGSDAAWIARATAPNDLAVAGISWLECFGIGARSTDAVTDTRARVRALANAHARDDLRLGLQPHAPYSAAAALYESAAEHGLASSHLAETLEELEFARSAGGPFADLLRRIGKWDDSILPLGDSPIEALLPALRRGRWVLAHGNYLRDRDLAILASLPNVALAYCPIASEYFGHVDHRYRELLARGANVCLGTDSAICQPVDAPKPAGILAQARRLWRRDRFDPSTLLAMATIHGARALAAHAGTATLQPNAPARLAKVTIDAAETHDPWLDVLESDAGMTCIVD
jgi:cytosine/adenosine deaminase-related metal-dependent hydrolase